VGENIIFVVIESGMAFFAIQLARLAISATEMQTDVVANAVSIHGMLNVIIISSVIVTSYFADSALG
jgi:hypothetical protein